MILLHVCQLSWHVNMHQNLCLGAILSHQDMNKLGFRGKHLPGLFPGEDNLFGSLFKIEISKSPSSLSYSMWAMTITTNILGVSTYPEPDTGLTSKH